ncbi:hypothetical protein BC832DRAFT_425896 [Gaertneriomyces semiglobifer]|nr:hypothetical protein BC832DRAFT_425896 [Gaertneriomyces semiglobifer]
MISASGGEFSSLQKYGLHAYRAFIFLTMVWFPVITIVCVVAIVRAAALNSLDVLDLFFKLFDALCGSLSISLFAHASGFLYSGIRLTSAMNKAKRLQGGGASGGKHVQGATVPRTKRNGLTETVRNLMIAVVFGYESAVDVRHSLFCAYCLLSFTIAHGLLIHFGFLGY